MGEDRRERVGDVRDMDLHCLRSRETRDLEGKKRKKVGFCEDTDDIGDFDSDHAGDGGDDRKKFPIQLTWNR